MNTITGEFSSKKPQDMIDMENQFVNTTSKTGFVNTISSKVRGAFQPNEKPYLSGQPWYLQRHQNTLDFQDSPLSVLVPINHGVVVINWKK